MGPDAVSVTLCVNAGLSFSFFGCGLVAPAALDGGIQ